MTKTILRKGLIIGLIILFVGASIVQSISGNVVECHSITNEFENFEKLDIICDRDQLDQEQTETGPESVSSRDPPMAQSFVPTLNVISRVILRCNEDDGIGELKISIRNDLDGVDITSITVPGNSLPPERDWFEFDFPDANIIPQETHYIV